MAATPSTAHTSRSRKPGGGFTLIELLAVMVIMGVMAGIAIPTLGSLSSSRAGGVQRQIQRDLTFARERAITTGHRSWVVFTPASNTYRVLAEPAGSPGRANAVPVSDPATGRHYTVNLGAGSSSGIAITGVNLGGGAEIGFDWRGRPITTSGAALSTPGVVTITGNRTVTVRPGWGLATIP